jgi:hypothetical protein
MRSWRFHIQLEAFCNQLDWSPAIVLGFHPYLPEAPHFLRPALMAWPLNVFAYPILAQYVCASSLHQASSSVRRSETPSLERSSIHHQIPTSSKRHRIGGARARIRSLYGLQEICAEGGKEMPPKKPTPSVPLTRLNCHSSSFMMTRKTEKVYSA